MSHTDRLDSLRLTVPRYSRRQHSHNHDRVTAVSRRFIPPRRRAALMPGNVPPASEQHLTKGLLQSMKRTTRSRWNRPHRTLRVTSCLLLSQRLEERCLLTLDLSIDSVTSPIQENSWATIEGTISDTVPSLVPVLVDFDELAHPGSGVGPTANTYQSEGLRFTGYSGAFGVGGDAEALTSMGSAASAYPGSASLLNRFFNGTIELRSSDNQPFQLNSLDISESNSDAPNAHRTLTFLGTKADGTSVSQSVTTDGTFGFESVTFTNFSDLTSVRWGSQSTHVDNVQAVIAPKSYELQIVWGDESVPATPEIIPLSGVLPSHVTWNPSLRTFAVSHRYLDDGVSPGNGIPSDVYSVLVHVVASDGGSSNATTTLSVGNVGPTAVDDTAVTSESQSIYVNVIDNDLDPSPLDVLQIFSGSAQFVQAPPGVAFLTEDSNGITFNPSTDFESLSEGQTAEVAIQYQVRDDDFGADYDTGILLITVYGENDQPIASAGPDLFSVEGTSVAFVGTISDVDLNDIHQFSWDFGDGFSNNTSLTPTHTYTNSGIFHATLTVSDPFGGLYVDTLQVEIDNLPPSLTSAGDVTVLAGGTAVNSGTWSDPGNDPVSLSASIGTVVQVSDGSWTWSLDTIANVTESQTVSIYATDSELGSSVSTFELLVLEAADLTATLDGSGNLLVSDTSPLGNENQITISVVGSNLEITDSVHTFSNSNVGSLSNGNHTLTLPLSSAYNSLQFQLFGGDDVVSIDLSGGDPIPVGGLSVGGGDGGHDTLRILGGVQGLVTYSYSTAHDGSVALSNFGVVTYSGLEPITNTGAASDVVFQLPLGTNAVSLQDDGIVGNGLTRLIAATLEQTDFTSPSGSITILRGSASDTLAIHSAPDLTSSLVIGNSAAPFASIISDGTVTLAAGKSLTAAAMTVNLLSAANINTSVGGAQSYFADEMSIHPTAQLSNPGGRIHIQPVTANRPIRLGDKLPTELGLTEAELDRLFANTISLGNATTGTISISRIIQPDHAIAMHLNTGGSIGSAGSFPRGLTISQFAAEAVGAIQLNMNNDFGTAVARSTTSSVYLNDANDLILGGIDGLLQTYAATNLTLTTQNGDMTVLDAFQTEELVATNLSISVGGTDRRFQQHPNARISATNSAGVLADKMDLRGQIVSNFFQIQPRTIGFQMNLGAIGDLTPNTLELSDDELSTVTANQLRIGSGTAGVAITNPVTVENATQLMIRSNGGLTQTGPLIQPNVNIEVSGSITLPSSNDVDSISITSTTGDIHYHDVDDLVIDLTNGQPAIHAPVGHVRVSLGTGKLELAGNRTIVVGNGLELMADRLDLDGTIAAPGQTVHLHPANAGVAVHLGSNTDVAPQTLELSDAELDRISAATLKLGDTSGADISLLNSISRSTATSIQLETAGDLLFVNGGIQTGGGPLQLTVGSTGTIQPISSGIDVTASQWNTSPGATLQIQINGPIVDAVDGYTQLRIAGNVVLTGIALNAIGSYSTRGIDTFILVNNDGVDPIVGTFDNLPEGALIPNFLSAGRDARVTYFGGDGNDVELILNQTPTILGNQPTVTELEGSPVINEGIFQDGDILDNLTLSVTTGPGTVTKSGTNSGTWTWTYVGPDGPSGPVDVVIAADDGNGEVASYAFQFFVDNVAPSVTADTNVVSVSESATAYMTGTYGDPGDDLVELVATTGNVIANPDGTWLWTFDTTDGPTDSRIVAIMASDSDGAINSTSFDLVVNNAAPTVAISTPLDGFQGVRGQTRVFQLTTTDPSVADLAAGFTYQVQWGDGSPPESFQGDASELVEHVFSAAGTYNVSVVATDVDSGVSIPFVRPVSILVHELQADNYAVGGTPLADTWAISPGVSTGLQVRLNGSLLGTFTPGPTGSLLLFGQSEVDTATITGSTNPDVFDILDQAVTMNGLTMEGFGVEVWQVNGGNAGDTFQFAGGSATINGGGGSDILYGPSTTTDWLLQSTGTGLIGNSSFVSVENLFGSGNADTLIRTAGPATWSLLNAEQGTVSGTTFSGFELLQGSPGVDTLSAPIQSNQWSLSGALSGQLNGLPFIGMEILNGNSLEDNFALSPSAAGFSSINGSGGNDSLVGSNTANIWTLTGANAGSLQGIGYTAVEFLQGGSAHDTLVGRNVNNSWNLTGVDGGALGTLDFLGFEAIAGGTGTDTINGPNIPIAWQLSGMAQGVVGSMSFSSVERLLAGADDDTFQVLPGAAGFSTLQTGSGVDTVLGVLGGVWNVAAANTVLYSGLAFAPVERLVAGPAGDTLVARNVSNTWQLSGNQSGAVDGLTFQGFDSLQGGGQADTFQVSAAAFGFTSVAGNAGSDIVQGQLPTSVFAIRDTGDVQFNGLIFNTVESLTGTGANDLLVGPNASVTWSLTATNTGTVAGYRFSEIESLRGGSGSDVFTFGTAGQLSGNLEGGMGVNGLNYSAYPSTRPAVVDLQAASATAVGQSVLQIQNVTGGAGADRLSGDSQPNILLGMGGNDLIWGHDNADELNGGSGHDVVVGGAGNDIVTGAAGKDLLIGGTGSDTLVASDAEDILIAGWTAHDNSHLALADVLAEWTSARTYNARIANLKGQTTTGLNATTFLRPQLDVFDDASVDQLQGGLQRDWYFANLFGAALDILVDQTVDELTEEL